jgi:ketosteroid isomerase-like protein
MPQHHQPSTLAALGRTWLEAWNARDLERVLTLYAEDTVMTSDRIPAMGFDASGTVRGKDALTGVLGQGARPAAGAAFYTDRPVRQP